MYDDALMFVPAGYHRLSSTLHQLAYEANFSTVGNPVRPRFPTKPLSRG